MKLNHLLFIATLALVSGSTMAATVMPFSQTTFDKLNNQGKGIIIDISATWCPTCKAQKPIIDRLSRDDAFNDVTVLHADFDKDKPVLKEFHVAMQSTLIAHRKGKEIDRSVGDTTNSGLTALFQKAAR